MSAPRLARSSVPFEGALCECDAHTDTPRSWLVVGLVLRRGRVAAAKAGSIGDRPPVGAVPDEPFVFRHDRHASAKREHGAICRGYTHIDKHV